MSGKCKYGEKCKFSHDTSVCEAWKSTNPSVTPREVLEEEGVDAEMNEVAPPELKGLVAEEPEEDGGGLSNEGAPQR